MGSLATLHPTVRRRRFWKLRNAESPTQYLNYFLLHSAIHKNNVLQIFIHHQSFCGRDMVPIDNIRHVCIAWHVPAKNTTTSGRISSTVFFQILIDPVLFSFTS